MSISNKQQKPNFGDNQGVWEYRTFDDELLGYSVRKPKPDGEKGFLPWSFQNNKWIPKWYKSETKPVYNCQLIKKHPDKSILIVEGEKAADAATKLLPDFVCVTWMGGGTSAGKIDTTHLEGKKVCVWPDNDKPGYAAAEKLKKRLKGIVSYLGVVNPKPLGVCEKWDLADFNPENDVIDLDMILLAIEEASKQIDDFEPIDPQTFPYLSRTGKIINTYENIEHLLNFYKISTRFNELRKEIEASIPYKKFTKANQAKLLLAEVTSLCNKNGVPRIDIPSWLMMVADKNAYNPVLEYLTSKKWDGICRKDKFFNTLECEDKEHRNFILERWMRGAVACGLSKNGQAHAGVLTLLGEQGNGKSMWIKKLIPEDLNLLLADYTFNPNNKDDVIASTKFWITELSEVASTVRRADVDALKSFLSRKIDVYRCPYDKADTEAPRKTAFVASVNDNQFLRDDTGNRRWWVIKTNNVDYEHDLDMQQVWAQFKYEYDQGKIHYLTREEIIQLNKTNEQYLPGSAVFEMIIECFRWDEPQRNLKASAIQVLYECGIETKGNNSLTREANKALQKLTGEKPIKIRGVYKYSVPRRNSDYKKLGY